MGFVIELFLVLFVVALILAAVIYGKSSLTDEQVAAKIKKIQEANERLYIDGETLRCLGCGNKFSGPLPEHGCPYCHVVSLVVAEKDYGQSQEAQNIVRKLS